MMEETTEAAETTTATINFDSFMVESKPCAAAYRDNRNEGTTVQEGQISSLYKSTIQ